MTDAAFDTLETMRDLEAAGVERAHAEAIAGAVRKAAVADRDALATKADITRLEAATKADIARLEDKLETKADKADLYRALWMQTGAIVGAIVATAAAVVVALLRLLP